MTDSDTQIPYWGGELKADVVRLETRADALDGRVGTLETASAVTTSEFHGLRAQLSKLDGSITWLTRTIIAAIITGVFSVIGGVVLFILTRQPS